VKFIQPHSLFDLKSFLNRKARVNANHGPAKFLSCLPAGRCFGNPAVPLGPVPARRSACHRKFGASALQALLHAVLRFGTQAWLSPPPHFWSGGPPTVTAGRRPTIARGLALSVNKNIDSLYIFRAILMPREIG